MRVCHEVTAVFDDPDLVSCAGLAPVLQLAERAGLARLVAEYVHLDRPGGVNAHLKVPGLVAGMVAGADSIEDMDLLRHGGMRRLFDGLRAPSTLGTFLRSFTFGHVRQLDSVAASLLARLAKAAPLLPGTGAVALVDIDDTVRQTHGYAKQGVGFGYFHGGSRLSGSGHLPSRHQVLDGVHVRLALQRELGCAPFLCSRAWRSRRAPKT